MSFIKINTVELCDLEYSKKREVLQTNTSGAYYFTTIIAQNTRKYQGLLVVPQDQIDQDQHMLLSSILEEVEIHHEIFPLGTQQYPGDCNPSGHKYIVDIQVDPIHKITYKMGQTIFTKEIVLCKTKNQILVRYELVDSKSDIKLRIRPFLGFRNKHTLCKSNFEINTNINTVSAGVSCKLYDPYDRLYIQVSEENIEFITQPDWYYNIEYSKEKERGYDYHEDLWVPGYFNIHLKKGRSLVLSAGLEEINPKTLERAFSKEIKKHHKIRNMEDCLVQAAKQFIIKKGEKTEIIAGYPWFGRWGRDTFIALPGLTLSIGDEKTCKAVIDTMVKEMQGALFPNLGSGDQAAMNSVDAPLWFFWTLQQYAEYVNSSTSIWSAYGVYLKNILEGYRSGTLFNIKMRDNGLIYAGEEGKALTWMDAAYQGEVFTTRMGFPVEINALWYNAVCFSVSLAEESGDHTFVEQWKPYIEQIRASFNDTFWDKEKEYLADVVQDNYIDWSIRPNQIFATSLPYIPLSKEQCISVVEIIIEELLTPYGLRTLSPKDGNYIGEYKGDQWSRDRAYHQGTVWPWLLGHFAEAYLKIYVSDGVPFIESTYKNFKDTLHEHGLGTISEVFDGDPPYNPGGAIAQAWSVAELIRVRKIMKKYSLGN